MKALLSITLLLTLASCSKESDKNELLTSIHWIELKPDDGTSKISETLSFLSDGTFKSEAGPITVLGKWSWKNENEIYLEIGGLSAHGETSNFDTSSNYHIRIVEISDQGLKTLELHEGDTWDSGFAQEKIYSPKNL